MHLVNVLIEEQFEFLAMNKNDYCQTQPKLQLNWAELQLPDHLIGFAEDQWNARATRGSWWINCLISAEWNKKKQAKQRNSKSPKHSEVIY